MIEGAETDPIVISLDVDDASLADRLAVLLAGVPGIQLAAPGVTADVSLITFEGDSRADLVQPLTSREVEVLRLVAEGASNKLIARCLGISIHTAKFHVGQILDKLDATGRTDAVAHAARLGVLHL